MVEAEEAAYLDNLGQRAFRWGPVFGPTNDCASTFCLCAGLSMQGDGVCSVIPNVVRYRSKRARFDPGARLSHDAEEEPRSADCAAPAER